MGATLLLRPTPRFYSARYTLYPASRIARFPGARKSFFRGFCWRCFGSFAAPQAGPRRRACPAEDISLSPAPKKPQRPGTPSDSAARWSYCMVHPRADSGRRRRGPGCRSFLWRSDEEAAKLLDAWRWRERAGGRAGLARQLQRGYARNLMGRWVRRPCGNTFSAARPVASGRGLLLRPASASPAR